MNYAATEGIATNHTAEEIQALKALVISLHSALVETTADAEMCKALLVGREREIAALRGELARENLSATGRDEGGYEGGGIGDS